MQDVTTKKMEKVTEKTEEVTEKMKDVREELREIRLQVMKRLRDSPDSSRKCESSLGRRGARSLTDWDPQNDRLV